MSTSVAPGIAAHFPPARGPRTTRVGIEHELLTRDDVTGVVVDPRRVVAASSLPVTFEPGGQVELNLACSPSAEAAARRLASSVSRLRTDCALVGVALDDAPLDSRSPGEVPLRLTSPRYLAMQRHFDAIGPAGRRMMRCTASTQVCLDWWPGAAGLEQWRVLNLAAPFLAAAWSRSARLAVWLDVDPDRTGFDDRLLHGTDPVVAYADFVRGATAFTDGGLAEHLTTLFPPVRPRGRYLELRALDVQPEWRVGEVLDVCSALLYDDDLRRRTLASLDPWAPRLGELWEAAAAGDDDVRGRGRELAACAQHRRAVA